jgi:NDP-sugar pyrophosphorylase family protein
MSVNTSPFIARKVSAGARQWSAPLHAVDEMLPSTPRSIFTSRFTGYREKAENSYHVSMGIYVYEPRALQYIERGKYLDFPDLVLRLLAAGEKVCAMPLDCLWLDIGRPDDYAKAQELFAEKGGSLDLV